MCMLAVDRWPSSLARSLPLVREAHPFCLHCSRTGENPHSATKPQQQCRHFQHHGATPDSSLVTLHGRGVGSETCRCVNRKVPPHFCTSLTRKRGKKGTLSSSAAQGQICSSTGPQHTMGCSTPEGQVPQEMPFFPAGVICVTKPRGRQTKALISLTYRAA